MKRAMRRCLKAGENWSHYINFCTWLDDVDTVLKLVSKSVLILSRSLCLCHSELDSPRVLLANVDHSACVTLNWIASEFFSRNVPDHGRISEQRHPFVILNAFGA